MGLHVVARLAARHGITVELRDSSGPGTIAEVSLPAGVLAAVQPQPEAPWASDRHLGDGAHRGEPHFAPGGQADFALAGPGPVRPQEPSGPAGSWGPPAAGSHRFHGDGSPDPRDGAAGGAPAPHPVHDEPGSPEVSSSGLPMRQRNPPRQKARETGAPQRSVAPAPKAPIRRRDSRQVSDVLVAYAQGINRSTSRRDRPTRDDHTERNEK